MKRKAAAVIAIIATAIGARVVTHQPEAIHYPRTAFYGRLATNGAPILRNGRLAWSAVDSAARFDVVVLDAPVMMLKPEIAEALKKSNPRMTLLALAFLVGVSLGAAFMFAVAVGVRL